MSDPREGITHPINIGQVYEDDRTGGLSKVIYLDEDVALLRDEDGCHRIENRQSFDANVGSGRYSLQPDEEFDYAGRVEALYTLAEEYDGEGGRKGSHKADALREAVDLLTEETKHFKSVPFEDLDGIGAKAAANLRREGYTTVNDIDQASDDELLSVDWVGEKGLDSLRAEADSFMTDKN